MPRQTKQQTNPNSLANLNRNGRPKGTKNRIKSVAEQLKEHGFDLISEILNRLPNIPVRDQVKTLQHLVDYVHPKLTAQALTVDAEVTTPRAQLERALLNKLLSDPSAVDAIKVLESKMPAAPKVNSNDTMPQHIDITDITPADED